MSSDGFPFHREVFPDGGGNLSQLPRGKSFTLEPCGESILKRTLMNTISLVGLAARGNMSRPDKVGTHFCEESMAYENP